LIAPVFYKVLYFTNFIIQSTKTGGYWVVFVGIFQLMYRCQLSISQSCTHVYQLKHMGIYGYLSNFWFTEWV